MKEKIKVGSLFAGVGGICLGLQQAENEKYQFEIEWANEVDEYASETYRTNFEHTLIEGDLTLVLHPEEVPSRIEKLEQDILNPKLEKAKITRAKKELKKLEGNFNQKYYEQMKEMILASKIDLLDGGFPCQTFSIAGKQDGFEDERGNLFLSIIELVNMLGEVHGKPRFLFLENVRNLKAHDDGNTYKVIKGELEKAGYIIKEQILNTMEFSDLPQNRERIFILGFLNKSDADKFTLFDNLETYRNKKNTEDRAKDVQNIINYDEILDSKYYYTKEKYAQYFIEENEYDSTKNKNVRINLKEDINEYFQFYQVRRGMYVRKNMSDVCPTLTANMGTGGHNVPLILVKEGIRKLTPTETFGLQGFPMGKGYRLPTNMNGKAYGDANLYKQAGNAVSVPIIKFISEFLLKILEEEKI